ncbi:3-oxoacyl-[acyl-carrier-protein] synthase III C-terminal domain-containing protein [Paenibacillus sp. FSL H8-0537]|uniref:3-oxoacyl-[acyl-carrier-protein] synthase III C-terminal domain-containing protein n=1 Tax=Paenibacillus sp. FSL H8-0537 TaxID=2921399 RepID=UPI0031012DB8
MKAQDAKPSPVYVSDFSVYVPEAAVTVEQAGEQLRQSGIPFDHSALQHIREMGFHRVPLNQHSYLEEMIYRACAPVIRSLRSRQKPVDRIIFAHTLQVDFHDRNLFAKFISDFSLSSTVSYSISQQNCASVHFALHASQCLLRCHDHIQGVLLVTADQCFHPYYLKIPDSLMGDAASCCYISKESNEQSHELIDTHSLVDGTSYLGAESAPEDLVWFNTSYYFSIRQVIREVLRRNEMNVGQIALIIGSNVNVKTWRIMASYLQCPEEKFFHTVPSVGHLFCTDIIHNIETAVKEGGLKPGDYYLTVTIGMGGVFGCGLHRYLPVAN